MNAKEEKGLGSLRLIVILCLLVVVVLIGIPALVTVGWQQFSPPPPEETYNPTIRLYVSSTKQIINVALDDYVKGVVAAEMPAQFHEEALKAQAVAARTYVLKRARLSGGHGCDSHPLADICDSPAHCQAWHPTATLQSKWGMIDFQKYWNKISQAVEATSGEILTYQGIAIDPLFHSTCGGHTEDAGDVWQKSLPYLKPVVCSYCQHAPKFQTDQRFALSGFLMVAKQLDGAITVSTSDLSGSAPPISVKSETGTGRVKELQVGQRALKGTTLRYALGLNSTRFTWKIESQAITFNVQGYGHGVGMCQYGADGMGKAGMTYRQILQHYYTGTLITKLR